MSGDPFTRCVPFTDSPGSTPCQPSFCGPYSQCHVEDGKSKCSCLEGYLGSPPSCRPECVKNTDCSWDEACNNNKCVHPCTYACGKGAKCQAENRDNPVCSCPLGFTGDPLVLCEKISEVVPPLPPQNPCLPNPCGPHSRCKLVKYSPSCSCLRDYIGLPPNCRSKLL
ncbi:notch homolog 2 N-terminal-like protein A [Halyomorpha halys]|uniref:notch homolog 2 N-terminal-like protein A n=1 Tax=Halyomorpha halys TaxID=286706 RepID=UPI0006D4DFF4|nr:neurogenic locus notch homolog protein 4-like isoform X3 [Halyomorpha halys]XP_014272249.1 neurogenic locus notch homolog protein 4-like isoform X1 [Halyomorpha halys]XP_024214971.1 neurogenic locus notch homolog protein 4-like isoform X1 [Halyomorpha halys]XP_024214972.1 neurogenic locus notch homolog protein 4-like isoform X2 [Halyomorpha halys]